MARPTRPDKERIMGQEEASATAIIQLLEPSDIKVRTLTDLNDEEGGVLTLLQTIGESLEIDEITKFVELFCQFRISRYRLGRRELGGIVTFSSLGVEEGRKRRSVKALFSGLR